MPEGLEGKKHFSKEIYYKLLAAELFPQYGRILCSDVDVVFRGDIAPSYFMHPGTDFYYAGVGQIIESSRMDTYGTDFSPAELEVLRQEIAAGYMLMNLDAIRRDGLQPTLTAHYLKNFHRLRLPEQDCLILCCWPKVRHLPLEYVVCNSYYRLRRPLAFDRTNPSLPPTQAEREALLAQAPTTPCSCTTWAPTSPNSLCCPCQGIWLSELWQARCVCAYLWRLPRLVGQKLRRYSLRRFVGKLGKRFSSGGDSG